LQEEFADELRQEAHPLAEINAVKNVSDEFARAELWNCVYRR